MARENVGHIDCPLCKTEQPVRKDKNDGLYINCAVDGLIQPKLAGGQSYLLENTRWLGSKPAKKPAATPPAGDDPTVPKEKATRRGPAQPPAPPAGDPPAAPVKKPSFLDDFP